MEVLSWDCDQSFFNLFDGQESFWSGDLRQLDHGFLLTFTSLDGKFFGHDFAWAESVEQVREAVWSSKVVHAVTEFNPHTLDDCLRLGLPLTARNDVHQAHWDWNVAVFGDLSPEAANELAQALA